MVRQQPIESALAEWIASPPATSAADDAMARALLLDSLGVMQSGGRTPVARKTAAATGDATDGWNSPLSPRSSVALAMQKGTAGAAELWDDTSLRMLTHPSVPILAALLAEVGRVRQDFASFLQAFTVGLEVELAVAETTAQGLYQRGFHSTGVLGSVAAAAALSCAHGMKAGAAGAAMGIGASLGSGLRVQFGSDMMPLHSGFAAAHGVQSVHLAEHSLTADSRWLTGKYGFASAFAGQEAAASWNGPSGLSHADIVLKQYPVGAPNVAPVNAALRAIAESPQRPEDIAAVRCRVHKWVLNTVKLTPAESPSSGRVSLPYCVAAALAMGENLPDAFIGEGAISPELRSLSEKVRVEAADVLDEAGHPTAEVEIITTSGQVNSATARDAYILPHLDGTHGDRLRSKFRKNWRWPNADAVEDFVTQAAPDTSMETFLALAAHRPDDVSA